MCPTSSSTNSAMCALPSPPPPSRCTQGGWGGHDLGPGREQPGHRVGAGGSALRLQPQVQQAGQRRVAHALRAHLPQTVPACPLGSHVCSGHHDTSSLHHHPHHHHHHTPTCPTTPVPPSVLWRRGDPPHPVYAYLFAMQSSTKGPSSMTPTSPPLSHPSPTPGRTIEVNIEAPAHSVLHLKGFYLCLLHPQARQDPASPRSHSSMHRDHSLLNWAQVSRSVVLCVCVVGWDSQGGHTIGWLAYSSTTTSSKWRSVNIIPRCCMQPPHLPLWLIGV